MPEPNPQKKVLFLAREMLLSESACLPAGRLILTFFAQNAFHWRLTTNDYLLTTIQSF